MKNMIMSLFIALCGMAFASAQQPQPQQPLDGATFKSKTYELTDGSEISTTLMFAAGKEVTVTTKGDTKTDVYLYVKGRYYEAKDTSPGPHSLIKFTPIKGDEKFAFIIVNKGGDNKVTLEVKVAE